MHVVLISTFVQPVALGMRYISAYLKNAGHRVTCLFVCTERQGGSALDDSVMADIIEQCQNADIVGLSVMTNSYFRSCQITEALRKGGITAPILWGGTHATVAPEESAEIADYVCIGEGEKAMLEFVENVQAGRDPSTTRGFACMKDGQLVRNPIYPLTDDLDSYPFPDYDMKDHFVSHKGRLVPAEPKLLGGTLRRYRLSSTRGCPYTCSFCNNATQLSIYRDAGFGPMWVRKRSAESIIAEIEHAIANYPSIKEVNLIDDLFLIRSEEEVQTFVDSYKERLDLPIELDAFPTTVTEPKIRRLTELKIHHISMGIQSGCQETLKNIYNRNTKLEHVAEAIRIISDAGLHADYHYLVNNPFESEESLVETLRFVADHHRGPAKVRLFPLQFFPGSEMYQRARAEGVIGDRHESAYSGVYHGKAFIKKARYLEIWLRVAIGMRNAGFSSARVHRVIDFAVNPTVRRYIDRKWFAPVGFTLYRVGHVLHKNVRSLTKPFRKSAAKKKRHAAGQPSAPQKSAA